MPGTFFGLEIAKSGLDASQIAMDTVGHNIANAATPGYSEQRVNLATNDPYTVPDQADQIPVGMIGTGVHVASITRATDEFVNVQIRNAQSTLNSQAAQHDALSQVESSFGEPSDTGLSHSMGAFFTSVGDLTAHPDDLGIRATVLQAASAMTQSFQNIQQRLSGVAAQLTNKVTADMSALNSYGTQIAALNVTIRQATAQGVQSNDLKDQRDQLIESVSKLANISVNANSDGTMNVAVGTSDLVVGTDSFNLSVPSLNARGDLTGGELGGLGTAQSLVSGYQGNLDTLASQTIAQVNAIHSTGAGLDGSTGLALFTGTNATNISVNPVIMANPAKLAAAAVPAVGTTVAPGDSTNAVALGNLRNTIISGTGTAVDGSTLSSFYAGVIANVGANSAAAKTSADSSTSNLTQLTNQKASETGVSTDSEMVDMLKYQRAYQASARVVKTMDDMVGTLINDMLSSA